MDEDPKTLRIIPGEYKTELYIPEADSTEIITLPFYRYRRHWYPKEKKFMPCSAGKDPDFAAEPCVGCTLELPPQDVYAYTVIHLDWYHLVPWEKEGKIQMNPHTQKPFMRTYQCEGRGCKMCLSDAEKVFGRRGHISFSYTQKTLLDKRATSTLTNFCKCGNELDLIGLVCPRCEGTMLDVENTELSDKEIKDMRRDGGMCANCKRTMRPLDIFDCDCGDPQQVSIYDVDVEISKIKTSDNKSSLQIDFFKPGPINELYTGDLTPYDFASIFESPTIEVQKMIYKYNGPITNAAESAVSEKY